MLLGLTGWLIQIGQGYKGLSKIQITKINLKNICLLILGKFLYIHGPKTTCNKTKEELNKDAAKEEYKN